jgi:hypothetical protein
MFAGAAGTSAAPASHIATRSVNSSPGNVTVCGSFGSRGLKTTLSPFLILMFVGRNSRTATRPSGLPVPAVTNQVVVPFQLWTLEPRLAARSETNPAWTSALTWWLTRSASSAALVPLAVDGTIVILPVIPGWIRQWNV